MPAERTDRRFGERAARGDVSKALEIRKRAGVGNPPPAGDELPSPKSATRRQKDAAIVEGSQSIDEQIRFAIAHKRLIQISYAGRVRVAEPHDYGVKNATDKLFVYQIRATPGANPKDFRVWRLLDLSKIEACTVLDDTFKGSRGDSYRDHLDWDIVYARVT